MYLKISAGFVASFMVMLMLSCSGSPEPSETPMASRMSDSVKVAWQQPQEALLRIHLESARPTDLLTEVAVKGAGIAQDVSVTALSKLMTHPFERDFAIEPCEGQTDVMVTATVGGETVLLLKTPHRFFLSAAEYAVDLSGIVSPIGKPPLDLRDR